MMVLLLVVCLLANRLAILEAMQEIIVENPFYLRARVPDSQTAHVLFEIALEHQQRTCQRYKFTIGRNREFPYAMPEQNLTFWRNSLELKHLSHGDYRICAIICSEHIKPTPTLVEMFQKRNHSKPITNCVNVHAYGSHLLVLTLYILVFIILAFSQIVFTLRKRKIQAKIKTALVEVEHILQRWRSNESASISTDQTHTYSILQSLITLPAVPLDPSSIEAFHPVTFDLEPLRTSSESELPWRT